MLALVSGAYPYLYECACVKVCSNPRGLANSWINRCDSNRISSSRNHGPRHSWPSAKVNLFVRVTCLQHLEVTAREKEGGRNRSLNNTRFHVPPRHPATLPPSWWNYTLPWIRSYSSCIHTPLPPHPPKHWCFLYLDGRLFSLLFTSLSSGWKRLRGREWTKTLPCHHSPSLFIYFCKSCEKIQNTF